MLRFLTIAVLLASPFLCISLQNTPMSTLAANTTHPPAGLPVPNPTRSYWLNHSPDANPLASVGSDGELTTDADVCIIGSGITGSSAAYHLARQFSSRDGFAPSNETNGVSRPFTVVILEARDFCSGATGRNGGHFTQALFLDFTSRVTRTGADEAKKYYEMEAVTAAEVAEFIQSHNLTDEVDLVTGGYVTMFTTDEDEAKARADYEAAKSAGLVLQGVEWLSKEVMNSTYGTPYPGVRQAGSDIYALKLATALWKEAQKLQDPARLTLRLHTHTPVTSISRITSSSAAPPSPRDAHHQAGSKRRWTLATPRGNITCSHVVHATNAYASHLLPHLSGDDGIIPTRGQLIAVRAAAPAEEITKASWGDRVGFKFWFPRPLDAGHDTPLIILGGGLDPATGDFDYYVTDDSVLVPQIGDDLKEFLPAHFPGKYEPGREPEMEWIGIMGYTKIGDPFIGPVIVPPQRDKGILQTNARKDKYDVLEGQYISAGYAGHGMTRAYSCARMVVDMIIAEMEGKKWEQPAWLPNHFLTYMRT